MALNGFRNWLLGSQTKEEARRQDEYERQLENRYGFSTKGLESPTIDPVDTIAGGLSSIPRGLMAGLTDVLIDMPISAAMFLAEESNVKNAAIPTKKGIQKGILKSTGVDVSNYGVDIGDVDKYVYRFKDGKVGEDFTQWADNPVDVSHYGKNMYRFPLSELADFDSFASVTKKKVIDGYEKGTLPADLEDFVEKYGVDEYIDSLRPEDIVETAGGWDWNGIGIEWLYENVIEKNNIKGIKTPNGGVVFDTSIVEKKENPFDF